MGKLRKYKKVIWDCVPYFILIFMVAGFIVFLFVINPQNEPVPIQPRSISTDVVEITVTGDTRQRTISITLLETSQTATITETRTVRRRWSATTAPSVTQERTLHSGNILNIHSFNGVLVIHEIETGRLHFI